jgi:nicotinamidase-related amidase
MIKDFFYPKGSIVFEHARRIIPNVASLLKEARMKNIPIIFVGDSLPKKSPEFEIWPEHGMKGTWGAEFLDELGRPTTYIEKTGFSPFFGKCGEELIKALRDLKVDTLVLCGICCEAEIKNMAYVATIEPGIRDPERPELGYDVIIPSDCVCHCFSVEETFRILDDIKRLCTGPRGTKVEITNSYELILRIRGEKRSDETKK